MLAIRLKRVGRSGHAQFRVIVQDSHFSPKRGRVVAYVGSYDPHTKVTVLDGKKITDYLGKGAQPSDRVVKLLKKEAIKLPTLVKEAAPKDRSIRSIEKLRRNRPLVEQAADGSTGQAAGAPAPVKEEATEADLSSEASAKKETPTQNGEAEAETAETPAPEQAAEAPEAPAEEPATELEAATEEPTTQEKPAADIEKEEPQTADTKSKASDAEVNK